MHSASTARFRKVILGRKIMKVMPHDIDTFVRNFIRINHFRNAILVIVQI